jgi:hypothetical protein
MAHHYLIGFKKRYVFLAHLAKGNVSFCHNFESVVSEEKNLKNQPIRNKSRL